MASTLLEDMAYRPDAVIAKGGDAEFDGWWMGGGGWGRTGGGWMGGDACACQGPMHGLAP